MRSWRQSTPCTVAVNSRGRLSTYSALFCTTSQTLQRRHQSEPTDCNPPTRVPARPRRSNQSYSSHSRSRSLVLVHLVQQFHRHSQLDRRPRVSRAPMPTPTSYSPSTLPPWTSNTAAWRLRLLDACRLKHHLATRLLNRNQRTIQPRLPALVQRRLRLANRARRPPVRYHQPLCRRLLPVEVSSRTH